MEEKILQKINEGAHGVMPTVVAGMAKLNDNKEMTVTVKIKITRPDHAYQIDGNAVVAFTQKEKFDMESEDYDPNQPDMFKEGE